MDKLIVGRTEKIKVNGCEMVARIDSGAARSSIDLDLAFKLDLGPIIKTVKVISSHGKQSRPVVEAEVEIKGKKIKTSFNIADRKDMKYPVLIGRNVLKNGFLVDSSNDENSNY